MPTADRAGMAIGSHLPSAEAELDEFVCSIPCVCPSELMGLVARLRRSLELHGVDITRPCSLQSDNLNCWIVGFLSPINKQLNDVNLELVEDAPQRLTLRSLDVEREERAAAKPDEDMLSSTVLSLYLLKTHRCVWQLCLDESALVFHFPDVVAAATAAAPGLTHIKLSPPLALQSSTVSTISALRKRSKIDCLDLSNLLLDDRMSKEVAALLQCTSIRCLTLCQFVLLRPAKRVLNALNSCGSLTALSIEGQKDFCGKLAEHLGKALKKNRTLRSLSVSNVQTAAAMAILKAIGQDSALENLSLACCAVLDGPISQAALLNAFTRLKSLRLSLGGIWNCNAFCFAANALEAGFCTLSHLYLNDTEIVGASALRLAQVLAKTRTRKRAHLEQCCLTAEVLKHFAIALEQNLTVEQVWLGGLPLSEQDISFHLTGRLIGRLVAPWNSHGLCQLSLVLRSGELALTRLELGWTSQAQVTAVSDVFRALCEYDRIEELSVYSGKPSDCMPDLVHLLETTRSLRKLSVLLKFCESETSIFMCALAGNRTLTEVALGHCTLLTNENASTLSTLVQTNHQLASLSCCDQFLRGKAFRNLAYSLVKNYVLVNLKFDRIEPYERDYRLVREILNRNQCLRNRAIQLLKNEAFDEDSLKAFRLLCDSYSLAETYAKVAKVSLQAAVEAIQVALDCYGRGEEK